MLIHFDKNPASRHSDMYNAWHGNNPCHNLIPTRCVIQMKDMLSRMFNNDNIIYEGWDITYNQKSSLYISFNDPADEAAFIVLTSGGIEL